MESQMPEQPPKFSLGHVVITPNALASLAPEDVQAGLYRHHAGDWGDVCPDDHAENELSLKHGLRLFSVYRSNGLKFWIITEADRSATTILMPEDY